MMTKKLIKCVFGFIALLAEVLLIPVPVSAQSSCNLTASPSQIRTGGFVTVSGVNVTRNGDPVNSTSGYKISNSVKEINNITIENGSFSLQFPQSNTDNTFFPNANQSYRISLFYNNQEICTTTPIKTLSETCNIAVRVTKPNPESSEVVWYVGVNTSQLKQNKQYIINYNWYGYAGVAEDWDKTFTTIYGSPNATFYGYSDNRNYSDVNGAGLTLIVKDVVWVEQQKELCKTTFTFPELEEIEPCNEFTDPSNCFPDPEILDNPGVLKTEICEQVSGEYKNICKECKQDDGIWTAIGCLNLTPQGIIGGLVRVGLTISGGIAVLLIIFGASTVAVSGSNPQRVQLGREIITAAIVGLVFILFSAVILQLIGIRILQLPGI